MVWNLILETLADGAVAALLLAGVGYLFKAQIAHLLNRDIESIKAKYKQDLEADRARYGRELEAYRTSLIAHAEAIKPTKMCERLSL